MATNELLPTATLQLKEGRVSSSPADARIPYQVDWAGQQRKLLIETAGAVYNYAQKVEKTREGLEVQKAVNEYHKELNEIQHNYKLQKGSNAVDGYNAFQQSVNDLGKKYQNYFSKNEMQSAFDKATLGLQTSAQMEGSNWYSSNVWQVDYDQKLAAKDLAQNDFVTNFNSPLESSYYTAYLEKVAPLAQLDGKDSDPKELQAYLQNDIDGLIKSAVSYQIDIQNLGGANAGLERYKKTISGKTYLALKAEIYKKQMMLQEHNERLATLRAQKDAAKAQKHLALIEKEALEKTRPFNNAEILEAKDKNGKLYKATFASVQANNPNNTPEQLDLKTQAEIDNYIAQENNERAKMSSAEYRVNKSVRGYIDAARADPNAPIDTNNLLAILPENIRDNFVSIQGSVEKAEQKARDLYDMGTYGVNPNAGKYLANLGDFEIYEMSQSDPDFANYQQIHGAFTLDQEQKLATRLQDIKEKIDNGELIRSDPTARVLANNLNVFTGGASLKKTDAKSVLQQNAILDATLKLRPQALELAKESGMSLTNASYQIAKQYSESPEWKERLNYNSKIVDLVDDCYEEHESEFDDDLPLWEVKKIITQLAVKDQKGLTVIDSDELMQRVYKYNTDVGLNNKILAPIEETKRKNSFTGWSVPEDQRLKTSNTTAPLKTNPYR